MFKKQYLYCTHISILLLRYLTEEDFNLLYGNICEPTGLHVNDKLVKVLGVSNTNKFNGISRSTLEAYRIESVANF
jgi:hypothetical protein